MPHLALVRKTPVVADIWAFDFAPSQPLVWQAGQFITVELPHHQADGLGIRRDFTIAGSSNDTYVRLATRIGPSSFKQALAQLPRGERLDLIHPPSGNFVWPQALATTQPLVMIATGIGITPFYAMIRERQAARLPIRAHLVYFHARTPLPFGDELHARAQADPSLVIHEFSNHFDAHQLAALAIPWQAACVMVSGPQTITSLLMPPLALSPRQVITDTFTGYSSASY